MKIVSALLEKLLILGYEMLYSSCATGFLSYLNCFSFGYGHVVSRCDLNQIQNPNPTFYVSFYIFSSFWELAISTSEELSLDCLEDIHTFAE